eukprot:15100576-Alexandrium_andersonii.AAC.1
MCIRDSHQRCARRRTSAGGRCRTRGAHNGSSAACRATSTGSRTTPCPCTSRTGTGPSHCSAWMTRGGPRGTMPPGRGAPTCAATNE